MLEPQAPPTKTSGTVSEEPPPRARVGNEGEPQGWISGPGLPFEPIPLLSPGGLANGGPHEIKNMYVRTYLRTYVRALLQRTCVRVRTYVRTYVCNRAGSGDTYVRSVHKGLKELLRNIKKQKSLIFCNQGVHRSGNGACMLLCAAIPQLEPGQAIYHLYQMRCISGLQQREAYKNVPALIKWFKNGGPWALQATFLPTSPLPPPPRNAFATCSVSLHGFGPHGFGLP